MYSSFFEPGISGNQRHRPHISLKPEERIIADYGYVFRVENQPFEPGEPWG